MNYNSVFEEEIESMNKFRYSLIHKRNEHWNDESGEYDKDGYDSSEDEKRIDELAVTIEKHIKLHIENLSFEFIMDQLANLGHAPNLLYDDNGHWAVTSTGFQNVVMDEPEDVEMHFMVEASLWNPTPREALIKYLSEE